MPAEVVREMVSCVHWHWVSVHNAFREQMLPTCPACGVPHVPWLAEVVREVRLLVCIALRNLLPTVCPAGCNLYITPVPACRGCAGGGSASVRRSALPS
jgi:hypothetical protein